MVFIKPIDVRKKMKEEGLPGPLIAVGLRRWALTQSDVQKVVLGYIGDRYSIAVLFEKPDMERFRRMYEDLEGVVSNFGDVFAVLYPLGPNQSNSLLLNTCGDYVIYP